MYKCVCEPDVSLGMKGAVAVREGGGGDGDSGGEGPPDPPDYGGWFEDVSNFDGTVDRLGEDTVGVTVGSEANGGGFGFGPAAVRVSQGTTVVWEWNGEGGAHNVVAEDGTFDSGDPVDEAGTTYEYTFEEPGIYKYICEPHVSLGMKGAIVVGAPPGAGGDGDDRGAPTVPGIGLGGGAVFLAFALPLAYAFYANSNLGARAEREEPPPETVEAPEREPAVELGHEDFDPWGTARLVFVYFLIVAMLWVFMYFVEFLGRVSITG
jgi:halocyanin-like protein